MKKLHNLIVVAAIVVGTAAVLITPTVNAVDIYQACGSGAASEVCASQGDDVDSFIKDIVNTLLFVAGALAVVMIIIGAIRYVASAGNSSQTTAAKNTILYSVVGLALAVFAFAIVNFVLVRLGLE